MRMLKIMTVLLLVLALSLGMTACAADQEKLRGTWETEVDFAGVFNNTLGNQEGAEYLKVESLKLKMILTFHEDDTYTLVADPASVEEAMAELKESLKAGMERYLVDTIAATGLHLGIDDILTMLNTDLDTLVGSVLTPELIQEMTGIMAAQGQYLAEDGKLCLSDSPEKEIDENIYETYVYEKETDKLILITPNTIDAYTDLLYPLEFTRAAQ